MGRPWHWEDRGEIRADPKNHAIETGRDDSMDCRLHVSAEATASDDAVEPFDMPEPSESEPNEPASEHSDPRRMILPRSQYEPQPLVDQAPADRPAETSRHPADRLPTEYQNGHGVPPESGLPEEESQLGSKKTSSVKPTAAPVERADPLMQSLLLLITMLIMLGIARYAVPRIVEEIRYAWHRGELRAEYETGVDGLRNVSLDTLSDAYEMVTSTVGPSVVHIDVTRVDDALDTNRLAVLPRGPAQVSDQGSGVIVDKRGYILTNRHVIADGTDITVTLSDGRRASATVIGSDQLTDLAVLQVDADKLFSIPWGDSDRCRVGSPVWAVGSPFGLDRTVTFGILSGKHRVVRAGSQYGASGQYQDFMQSDVAVNPGNSGGPLVDARGTLVGINTAIVGDTYQGVSFSIPSNVARDIYKKILKTGRVERGWLGVVLAEVDQDQVIGDDLRVRGAYVQDVPEADSPAGRAGLIAGDIIRSVDGEAITDVGHLMRLIGRARQGSVVKLGVSRNLEAIEVPVVLEARPREFE